MKLIHQRSHFIEILATNSKCCSDINSTNTWVGTYEYAHVRTCESGWRLDSLFHTAIPSIRICVLLFPQLLDPVCRYEDRKGRREGRTHKVGGEKKREGYGYRGGGGGRRRRAIQEKELRSSSQLTARRRKRRRKRKKKKKKKRWKWGKEKCKSATISISPRLRERWICVSESDR